MDSFNKMFDWQAQLPNKDKDDLKRLMDNYYYYGRIGGNGGGEDPVYKGSYAVLTDGTIVKFSIDDTPMSNFSLSPGGSSIILNGMSYSRGNVETIYLSKEYDTTEIPINFFFQMQYLKNVDISELTSIEKINGGFFASCERLEGIEMALPNLREIGISLFSGCTNLSYIDLSIFSNLTKLEHFFLNKCESLKEIDLSSLSNITSVGNSVFASCFKLKSITINRDWTGVTLGTNVFANIPNEPTRIIQADTPENGEAFKTKFPNLSNWTVDFPQ